MRLGFLFVGTFLLALPIAPSARADGAVVARDPWDSEAPADPPAPPRPRARDDAQKSPPPAAPSKSSIPCMFVPRRDCRDYPLWELSLSGGETHSYVGWQWTVHGTSELGLLVAATPYFHWGPVFELGFDAGRITSGWSAVPKVRGRLWLGNSNFTLEGSVGTLFQRYSFHDGFETQNRIGAATDLAISYHAVGSLLGSFSFASDPTGNGGAEVRLLVGFRASLIAWGAIIAAPFAAYGMGSKF